MPEADPPPDDLPETARFWVARLASGAVTEADMAAFDDWVRQSPAHRTAFDAAQGVWRDADHLKSAFYAPDRSARIVRFANRRPVYAAGAALAAVLVIAVFAQGPLRRAFADHATGTGQIASLNLPDGTQVVLDTDSALDVNYSGSERRVRLLQGRAWFKVVHRADKPFVVQLRDGAVTDIGTAFAVADDESGATVSVTQGRVQISAPSGMRDVTAGLQAHWKPDGTPAAPHPFDQTHTLAWIGKRIVLDGVPLRTAVRELGRYRPGTVLLFAGDAADRPVSGVFSTDRIDDGLATLAASQSLTIRHLTPWLVILMRRG